MVNPIIANLIKNSIKNSIKNTTQTGGGLCKAGEENICLFLTILFIVSFMIFFIDYFLDDVFEKDDMEKTKEIIYMVYGIFIPVYIIFVIVLYKFTKNEGSNGVKYLFSISFICLIPFLITSYLYKLYESDKIIYLSEYIGVNFKGSDAGKKGTLFGVGLVTNLIFGFIDNFGLFYGMDAIDNYVADVDKKENESNESYLIKRITKNLTIGGIGNTFSDFIGASLGNAVGDMASTLYQSQTGEEPNTPIISEMVGIVLGCLLGLYIPRAMKSSSLKSKEVKDLADMVPISYTDAINAYNDVGGADDKFEDFKDYLLKLKSNSSAV